MSDKYERKRKSERAYRSPPNIVLEPAVVAAGADSKEPEDEVVKEYKPDREIHKKEYHARSMERKSALPPPYAPEPQVFSRLGRREEKHRDVPRASLKMRSRSPAGLRNRERSTSFCSGSRGRSPPHFRRGVDNDRRKYHRVRASHLQAPGRCQGALQKKPRSCPA